MSDTIRASGTLDLTVHRRDPDVKPDCRLSEATTTRQRVVDIAREHIGHLGGTICGRRLNLDELWTDHEPEARDSLCPRCFR